MFLLYPSIDNVRKQERHQTQKSRSCDRLRSCNGADNGARTRDPNLGKVVLYQLSHVRVRGKTLRDFAPVAKPLPKSP